MRHMNRSNSQTKFRELKENRCEYKRKNEKKKQQQ